MSTKLRFGRASPLHNDFGLNMGGNPQALTEGHIRDMFTNTCIHGHRTPKAPHPVRSAKLTGVPPS